MKLAVTKMEIAAKAIVKAKRCVVFSGAGMSADSGIDTFRSSGTGFWTGIFGKIALVYGGTPVGWNLTPGIVWSYFINTFLKPIMEATPHAGYLALSKLEKLKFNDSNFHVVTMNVDELHQAGGTDPSKVFEIHGSVRAFRCITCHQPMLIADPLSTAGHPPRCACGGYPRPAVTLFTEALPFDQWRGASLAVRSMAQNDVMLVIGTSSVVYPAASLPEMAKQQGVVLIEINPDESTPLSQLVDIHLKGGAAETLTALFEEVERVVNEE